MILHHQCAEKINIRVCNNVFVDTSKQRFIFRKKIDASNKILNSLAREYQKIHNSCENMVDSILAGKFPWKTCLLNKKFIDINGEYLITL